MPPPPPPPPSHHLFSRCRSFRWWLAGDIQISREINFRRSAIRLMPLYCSTHRCRTIKTKSFLFIVSFLFTFFYAQMLYIGMYGAMRGVYVLTVCCRPGGIGTCLVCHWLWIESIAHGESEYDTHTRRVTPFIPSVIKTGTKTELYR